MTRHFTTRYSLLLALVMMLVVSFSRQAHAQLLLDQAIGGSVGGGTELGSFIPAPVSPSVIMQNLQQQGYSAISAVPATVPQQFMAMAPNGIAVLLTIEPRTGQIISAVPQ